MTANLSTVTFRANAEDIEACRLVFQEHGITLEEGIILFLRHVAETRKLPDFIEKEHLRHLAGRRLVNNLKNAKSTPAALALSQEDINHLIDSHTEQSQG